MKNLLVNSALAVASLLIFAALTEGALRVAGIRPEHSVNPIFSWKRKEELWLMAPGATWNTRVGNHPVQVNAYGLRDREIGPCTPSKRRILLLGDSVTFGHGQPIEATVARELERTLAGSGLTVQVVNAGIPGWSTRQQLRFYEQHGVALCPDLVIVGFVLNDVTELHRGLIELGAEQGLVATSAITWLSQRTATIAGFKQLYGWLLDPAGREIRRVEDLVHRAQAPEVQRAMASVHDELDDLLALTRERHDRFGLVIFPFRFQLLGDGLDAPQASLSAFGHERGMPVLDTLPLLREHPPDDVFMDHDHFTGLGHRIVAKAIADWIQRDSLLDRPPEQPAIDSHTAANPYPR